jgi:hypothetical protein
VDRIGESQSDDVDAMCHPSAKRANEPVHHPATSSVTIVTTDNASTPPRPRESPVPVPALWADVHAA